MEIFGVNKEKVTRFDESRRFIMVLVVLIISLPVLLIVLNKYQNSPFDHIFGFGGLSKDQVVLEGQDHANLTQIVGDTEKSVPPQPVSLPKEKPEIHLPASEVGCESCSKNVPSPPLGALPPSGLKNESLQPTTTKQDDLFHNETAAPGGVGEGSRNSSSRPKIETKPDTEKSVPPQPVSLPKEKPEKHLPASEVGWESSSKNVSPPLGALPPSGLKNESLEPTTTKQDDLFHNETAAPGGVGEGSRNSSSRPKIETKPGDKLLHGLLAPGFDEISCLSRYQNFLYRKTSPHEPSAYLISKLRRYEALHKHCGPHSNSYRKALKVFKSGKKFGSTRCKYVVWIPVNGLGNRMISMAATFLYALLTDRVLLVYHRKDMTGLFCEPFPDSSWVFPKKFPYVDRFTSREFRYGNSFGAKLKNGTISSASMESPPSYLYLNLDHSDFDFDRISFYCDQSQALLQQVPWLFLISDQYFVPSFFLMPSFKQEMTKMFPERETVFHHLGRYLFHPTNEAWGLITKFYDAYLAKADERIGLQVRVFNVKDKPFQAITDQILDCSLKEKILPEVDQEQSVTFPPENNASKAILITSLHPWFYENISRMYWSKPSLTGEVVGVYQPSSEGYQHSENIAHNMKAWTDIYLLSLCNKLVTSAWSTFGYVAQGLAGLKPWILYRFPNPACVKDLSMEPCFHFPPTKDCTTKRNNVEVGKIVPYLRHCRDLKSGVKLVSDQDIEM